MAGLFASEFGCGRHQLVEHVFVADRGPHEFDTLAKESKDPGSAATGGDLGWNTASTFVKEFSDAMVSLEKGKTVTEPVKTQFGYHVIRLDDVRDATPPPLDQVKPQIQQQLERQKVQQLQQELRAAAKVE